MKPKHPGGRPSLTPGEKTCYLNLGEIAVTEEQESTFVHLCLDKGGKSKAVRFLLDDHRKRRGKK